MTKKNPIVAAVLNFFLFGGGTLYVGKRPAVGLLMLIGGNLAQGAEIKVSPAFDNSIPGIWPFLIGGLVVVKLACALDDYREAKAG